MDRFEISAMAGGIGAIWFCVLCGVVLECHWRKLKLEQCGTVALLVLHYGSVPV